MIVKLLIFSLAVTSVLLIASALGANHPAGHPDIGRSGDSCQSCHPAAQSATDDAPAQAAPQLNNRVLATDHTNRGPDVIRIDRMARYYSPVPFAHKIHADMSEMNGGCANCHHYNQQSDTPAACVECHPSTSGEGTLDQPGLKGAYHRQCLNCHRDWAHENACEYCHTERMNPYAPEIIAVTPSRSDSTALTAIRTTRAATAMMPTPSPWKSTTSRAAATVTRKKTATSATLMKSGRHSTTRRWRDGNWRTTTPRPRARIVTDRPRRSERPPPAAEPATGNSRRAGSIMR